ncbi:hypothetical protein Q766_19010 [Flavobacterium subsaxonicum WB 4.1-42 = DSM 21790]|uniref:Uncharacterized protein n=2 Tax=Flavobacterium TaxID=237 RepID=A0A0A2MIH5_9FLAO|nr:hypothetical protein Q766_19010 [Flavobacterium subsaxonicum WB 4.1-42 = DSM 21790]
MIVKQNAPQLWGVFVFYNFIDIIFNIKYADMKFIILLLLFALQGYSQKTNFYEEDTKVNLFAFIGQKISIEEFDPNLDNKKTIIEIDKNTGDTVTSVKTSYSMDRAFIAKYKVIQPVFNNLKQDTISFAVYDHYGTPEFAEFDNVIIYISAYN